MRLLIAMLVWAAAIAGAAGVSKVVADTVHKDLAASAAAAVTVDVGKIKATDARSLFAAANFSTALSTAGNRLGRAEVSDFVVYPGYLSLTADTGSTSADLYVSATGTVDTTSLSSPAAPDTLFPFSLVKAGDLATLAQRIAAKAHIPESQLGYFVAQVGPSKKNVQWLIYTIPGSRVEYFQVNGTHGRLLELPANGSSGLKPVKG
jgi:hypothetical protein